MKFKVGDVIMLNKATDVKGIVERTLMNSIGGLSGLLIADTKSFQMGTRRDIQLGTIVLGDKKIYVPLEYFSLDISHLIKQVLYETYET